MRSQDAHSSGYCFEPLRDFWGREQVGRSNAGRKGDVSERRRCATARVRPLG